MAITLTTDPSTRVSAYNDIEFLLTPDDPGTPPVEISVIYQLEVDGTNATEIEVVPYRSSGILLNFKDDLQPYVYTTKPTIDSTTVTTDSNIVKPFTLKYGERELDTSDCSVTQSLSTETSDYFVYNTALQFFGTEKLSSNFVMSLRPRQNFTTPTGNDWLYIHVPSGGGAQPIGIYAEGLKSDGDYLLDSTTLTTGSVHIVPIGRGNGFFKAAFDAENIVKYTILIYNGSLPALPTPYERPAGVDWVFDFDIECKTSDQWRELYWLEPSGGYAGLNFEIESFSTSREGSDLLLKKDCAQLYTVPTLNGRVSKATSNRKITLKKTLKYNDKLRWFLDGLLASNTHMIKARTPDNRTVAARFILDGGDYRFFNDQEYVEFTVSGSISSEILAQGYE